MLEPLLPDFAVRMGGTTSIDVTKPGVDKAYGMARLREQLAIPLNEMLFVGDAIFVGGNDFPVQEAGVDSILVRDPRETARIIQTVLACLGDGPADPGTRALNRKEDIPGQRRCRGRPSRGPRH